MLLIHISNAKDKEPTLETEQIFTFTKNITYCALFILLLQRVPVVLLFTINWHKFVPKVIQGKWLNQRITIASLIWSRTPLLPLEMASGPAHHWSLSRFLGLSVWCSPWAYHFTTCSFHELCLLIASSPRHDFNLLLSSHIHHEAEHSFFGGGGQLWFTVQVQLWDGADTRYRSNISQ